ncbi:DUF3164 family protein [Ralstonia pseudosolanacearum]|uniref:DUF3164 family protein n=1 Tax=Ralstonia pseudosolanacearum TaxID=1310165 RepID=UPI0008DA35AE|nr:DUF3164 family protein [Ralstonia pseudosolanacearum]MCL1618360.1 DUF3164 family protein [Ralstonia pseudosolanacearum CaRs-Mep]
MTHASNSAPADYMTNAQGHLVPKDLVKPIDLARDQIVQELFQMAATHQEALRQFKHRAFQDIEAFVDMSAEQYDVKLGGVKGNVTLPSFDGKYKIQLSRAENLKFDERLQAAKAIIDELLTEWSEGSRPEIKAIVQRAFDTDKEGNLNTGRVLSLRNLDIKDPRWQKAMAAIGDSVQVVGTKSYVRFYERIDGTDEYKAVLLDIAKV